MGRITRRRFLEDSALLLAAASVPVKLSAAEGAGSRSPNEKIRIGIAGLNGRGMSLVSGFADMEDVEVAAICDPDTATWDRAAKAVTDRGGANPKTFQDIRKMLEMKDLDAIGIATQNHWHALAAIWAMQAGKDVYCEKPSSHNVFEGQKMVEAAQKYNRICQVGTQSRANPGMRDAIQYIHDGYLGEVKLARGLCYKPRGSIGFLGAPVQPPATVDYDLWLGPAPMRPVRRRRFHYDWHWLWDYGNGDFGNQGVHEVDKARWGLNQQTLPKSIVSYGGRFGYFDNGLTPNTQVSIMDYEDGSRMVFEVRGLATEGFHGASVGNIWYGTEGRMVAPSYSSAIVYDNDGQEIERFAGSGNHFRNFIDAMRSRKAADLYCDAMEGHLSSSTMHLANVSYRLGQPAPFTRVPAAIAGDTENEETFKRFTEHLKANGVSVEFRTFKMGPRLEFDPKAMKFKDASLNQYLTRQYREPFVVPDRV